MISEERFMDEYMRLFRSVSSVTCRVYEDMFDLCEDFEVSVEETPFLCAENIDANRAEFLGFKWDKHWEGYLIPKWYFGMIKGKEDIKDGVCKVSKDGKIELRGNESGLYFLATLNIVE